MGTGGAVRWSAAGCRRGGTRAQEHSNYDPASHLIFPGRAGYQAQWKPATVFSMNLR
jgi:hypothetical protein